MPLKPVTGTLHMPVKTTADVHALFEEGLKLVHHPSASHRKNAARDMEDHFFYLGAVPPRHARALQTEFVRLSDEQLEIFSFRFAVWLYLLHGADDACADTLAKALNRRPTNRMRWGMLAAIGTPAALTKLAVFARKHDRTAEFERMGFEIPLNDDPAQPRFTLWRRAIKKVPCAGKRKELRPWPHPIGLPLAAINASPASGKISWHYLSLELAALEGVPPLAAERLHLVSPPMDMGWTLYCDVRSDGKYETRAIERSEREESELDAMLRAEKNDTSKDRGYAELLPYNSKLTYRNGHTLFTRGVVGNVGGPPIGLYPNPKCITCGRLMFHLLTVTADVRRYGEGNRSLFVCEDCRVIACHATWWN